MLEPVAGGRVVVVTARVDAVVAGRTVVTVLGVVGMSDVSGTVVWAVTAGTVAAGLVAVGLAAEPHPANVTAAAVAARSIRRARIPLRRRPTVLRFPARPNGHRHPTR